MSGHDPLKLLVAQIGARRHYAVPRALHEAGVLDRLMTDACGDLPPWSLIDLVPARFRKGGVARLAARRTGLPGGKVTGFFFFTVSAFLGPWQRKSGEDNITWWLRRNRRFNELVLREGFGLADGVYVFNGAGLEILREARRRGLFCVLDQTSAPMRHDAGLLAGEAERWPDWATEAERIGNWLPMAEREEEEWQLADRIICGSEYVVESVRAVGCPAGKCRLVRYGYHLEEKPLWAIHRGRASTEEEAAGPMSTMSPKALRPSRKLRVLFAGTLNLRKGIPYFYETILAFGLERAEWRIVGPAAISEPALARIGRVAELCGTVPRTSMADQYAWADVLVLPTISEGSANVCYEALAHGVPVITTSNAGSVVRDGIDGFVVPIRSSEAISERLLILQTEPERLLAMSGSALARAGQFNGKTYAASLRSAIGG